MDMSKYLEITNELANPETDVARRTELLSLLTEDYKAEQEEKTTLTSLKEEQQKQIQDLTHSHSLMFRKLGVLQTDSQEAVKQQTHSETITLDQIEGGI